MFRVKEQLTQHKDISVYLEVCLDIIYVKEIIYFLHLSEFALKQFII